MDTALRDETRITDSVVKSDRPGRRSALNAFSMMAASARASGSDKLRRGRRAPVISAKSVMYCFQVTPLPSTAL